MAASDERVRLDIGFKGGATLTVAVTVPEADALEQRLRQGDGGVVELDADDGRLLVVARARALRPAPRPRQPSRLQRRDVAGPRLGARESARFRHPRVTISRVP